jgi:hypothetical protein
MSLLKRHWTNADRLLKVLENYLMEGVLVSELVLNNNAKLMGTARECNVTIRWLMLRMLNTHTHTHTHTLSLSLCLSLFVCLSCHLIHAFSNTLLIHVRDASVRVDSACGNKKVRELVMKGFDHSKLLLLVLKTAQVRP